MGKTLLFCTSSVEPSADAHDAHGWARYRRWIEYYSTHLNGLGAAAACLINDGGVSDAPVSIYDATVLPDALPSDAAIIRFPARLGRRSLFDCPGWWRSFCFSQQLARHYGYGKLIHIESDFFVLSPALIDYIASLSSGWTALFSRYYQVPETGVQIICEDAFGRLEQVSRAAEASGFACSQAELALPFTTVERRFIGDRLGEAEVFAGWQQRLGSAVLPLDYIGNVESSDVLTSYRSSFQFTSPW
jgi:hypothetical protein